MMRPPSREEVRAAQPHLVLLKSKMRQRQSQQSQRSQPSQQTQRQFDNVPFYAQGFVEPGPRTGFRDQASHRSYQDEAPAVPERSGRFKPVASAPASSGGKVAPPRRSTVAKNGMTWDPPDDFAEVPPARAPPRRPQQDGYPGASAKATSPTARASLGNSFGQASSRNSNSNFGGNNNSSGNFGGNNNGSFGGNGNSNFGGNNNGSFGGNGNNNGSFGGNSNSNFGGNGSSNFGGNSNSNFGGNNNNNNNSGNNGSYGGQPPSRGGGGGGSGGFPGDAYPVPSSRSMAMSPGPSANQLSEYPDDAEDDGPTYPCPDCGRSFRASVLEKHARICKKVFVQKRKPFDVVANRLGEFDNASELIAKAKRLEQEKEQPKPPAKKKESKDAPKWQKQSLEFRQAMLAAKAASGDAAAAAKAAEIQVQLNEIGGSGEQPGMVKCPHCGRTFNKEAGERHVAICLKTFGSKNAGGRLIKGGGRNMNGMPTSTPSAPSRYSDGPGGSAMVRRPSQNRRP